MSEAAIALYIHPAKQAVDLYDTPARRKFGRPYGLMPMGVPALVNLLRDNGISVRGVNFPMEKRLRIAIEQEIFSFLNTIIQMRLDPL